MPPPAAPTAEQRRAARVASAGIAAVERVRAACHEYHGLNLKPYLERAVAMAEEADAGCPKTATVLLMHTEIEADYDLDDTAEVNTFLDTLRGVAASGGGAYAHTFPADNRTSARTRARAFIETLRVCATGEAAMFAEAGRASPAAVAATAHAGGGPMPPGSATVSGGLAARQQQLLNIRSEKDKQADRLANLAGWISLHDPAPEQQHAILLPHKDAILAFDPYTLATSTPRLPQLIEVTRKGRLQVVPPGRASPLGDFISAFFAFGHAYAGPMPAGYSPCSEDKTMLEFNDPDADPDSSGAYPKVRRAPALAAYAVNRAVATAWALCHPLTEDQQKAYANAAWAAISTEMTTLQGRSLTRAVIRALEKQLHEDTAVLARTAARAQVPGVAGARREREREREREQRREVRPKLTSEQRQAKPLCGTWQATGRCADKDKCQKTKRHPDQWAGLGKAKYESARDPE